MLVANAGRRHPNLIITSIEELAFETLRRAGWCCGSEEDEDK
jgi:hypothetical protein